MTIEFRQIKSITEKRVVLVDGIVKGSLTRYRPHGWLIKVEGYNPTNHRGRCLTAKLDDAKTIVRNHFGEAI